MKQATTDCYMRIFAYVIVERAKFSERMKTESESLRLLSLHYYFQV